MIHMLLTTIEDDLFLNLRDALCWHPCTSLIAEEWCKLGDDLISSSQINWGFGSLLKSLWSHNNTNYHQCPKFQVWQAYDWYFWMVNSTKSFGAEKSANDQQILIKHMVYFAKRTDAPPVTTRDILWGCCHQREQQITTQYTCIIK